MKKIILFILLCSTLFAQDPLSRRGGGGGVALVWDFGFEEADLTAFEAASTWTNTGTPAISTTQKYTGNSSLYNNAGDYTAVYVNKTGLGYTEIYASFWIYCTALPAYSFRELFVVYTVSGSEMSVLLNSTGTLGLTSGYSSRGATTATVSINTWTNVKVHFKFTTGATICEVILGAETKTDNTSITTSNINELRIGTLANGPNSPIYTDVFKASTVGYP